MVHQKPHRWVLHARVHSSQWLMLFYKVIRHFRCFRKLANLIKFISFSYVMTILINSCRLILTGRILCIENARPAVASVYMAICKKNNCVVNIHLRIRKYFHSRCTYINPSIILLQKVLDIVKNSILFFRHCYLKNNWFNIIFSLLAHQYFQISLDFRTFLTPFSGLIWHWRLSHIFRPTSTYVFKGNKGKKYYKSITRYKYIKCAIE